MWQAILKLSLPKTLQKTIEHQKTLVRLKIPIEKTALFHIIRLRKKLLSDGYRTGPCFLPNSV